MPAAPTSSPEQTGSIYGFAFWLAYLANVLLVCANSVTFKFAEFVAALGGSEALTGSIFSFGLILAVVMRLGLGQAIDRHGPRLVWLAGGCIFVAGNAALLMATQLSPLVWGGRLMYQLGLAAMFSCSMVHIQNQVPPHRRTEVIGSLGSSGFVGTIVGTQLGDLIFRSCPLGRTRFLLMFGTSAALGVLHFLVVLGLTWRDRHERPPETPAAHRLLMKYWPGEVVWVGLAMGCSFAVTTLFLTRYVTACHLRGLGTFFLAYSITAFSCRWLLRNWARGGRRHRMVLWGLTGLTLGLWSLNVVTRDVVFLLPAVLCGFGHALLFPAVVSRGAGAFPPPFRGSGTTLVLGFMELGTVLAAPLLGELLDWSQATLPARQAFTPMFLVAGSVPLVVGVFYALTAARKPDLDWGESPEPPVETLAAGPEEFPI